MSGENTPDKLHRKDPDRAAKKQGPARDADDVGDKQAAQRLAKLAISNTKPALNKAVSDENLAEFRAVNGDEQKESESSEADAASLTATTTTTNVDKTTAKQGSNGKATSEQRWFGDGKAQTNEQATSSVVKGETYQAPDAASKSWLDENLDGGTEKAPPVQVTGNEPGSPFEGVVDGVGTTYTAFGGETHATTEGDTSKRKQSNGTSKKSNGAVAGAKLTADAGTNEDARWGIGAKASTPSIKGAVSPTKETSKDGDAGASKDASSLEQAGDASSLKGDASSLKQAGDASSLKQAGDASSLGQAGDVSSFKGDAASLDQAGDDEGGGKSITPTGASDEAARWGVGQVAPASKAQLDEWYSDETKGASKDAKTAKVTDAAQEFGAADQSQKASVHRSDNLANDVNDATLKQKPGAQPVDAKQVAPAKDAATGKDTHAADAALVKKAGVTHEDAHAPHKDLAQAVKQLIAPDPFAAAVLKQQPGLQVVADLKQVAGKLTSGALDDGFEQEADQLADQVMRDVFGDELGTDEQEADELGIHDPTQEVKQDPSKAPQVRQQVAAVAQRKKQTAAAKTTSKAAQISTKGAGQASQLHGKGAQRETGAKTKGAAAQQQAKQAAQQKKVAKAKSIDEVKAKLGEGFKAKEAALKQDTETQRADLKTKLTAEKTKLDTEIKTLEAKLKADIDKKNVELEKKIGDKKKQLEQQNEVELKKAETTTKAEQAKIKAAADAEILKIESTGKQEADKARKAGASEATSLRGKGETDAKHAKQEGEHQAASAIASANSRAAKLPEAEQAAARKQGQSAAASARSNAAGRAGQAHAKGEADAKAAIAKANGEADKRLATAKDLGMAARAKADTASAGLDKSLADTRTKLAKNVADMTAQMEAERKTLLVDVQKFIDAQKKEIQVKTDESNVRLNQLEKDTLAKIDGAETAAKKKIQQAHDDMLIKLEGPNASKELAKLDEETNKVLEDIDKSVAQAQMSVRAEVKEAQAAAAKQTQERIAAVQAEGKKTQDRITAKTTEAEQKIDAAAAQAEAKNKTAIDDQARDVKAKSAAAVTDVAAMGDKSVADLKKTSEDYEKQKAADAAVAAAATAAEEKRKADEEAKKVADEKKKVEDEARAKEAERKAFEARTKGASDELFKAMDGMGTDEKKIFGTLQGKTPEEMVAIKSAYQARTGRSLEDDMTSEMSGSELKEAKALLNQDPVQSKVAALQNAMEGWGTDEKKVKETLASITDPELKKKVVAEYEKATGEKLGKVLAAEGMESEGVKPDEFKAEQAGSNIDPEKLKKLTESKDVKLAASSILAATDRWGTDEAAISKALKGKTPEEIAAIKAAFKEHSGGKELDDVLEEEMEGTALKEAKALMSGDPVQAAVAQLQSAADGWGTDKDKIHSTLKEIEDPELRRQVKEQYEKQTGDKLDTMLEDELSGFDKDKAKAYMGGNKGEIAAVEADEAMHGGFLTSVADGLADTAGVDRKVVRDAVGGAVGAVVLGPLAPLAGVIGGTQIGTDFGTDNKALYAALESAKTVEEREALKAEYKKRTGKDLMTDVDADLEGKEKDVAKFIMAGDKASAEAAKMAAAADGIGTDRKAIYEALEKAGSKAERDAMIAKYNELYGKKGETFEKMIDSELDPLDKAKAEQLAAKGRMDDGFALYYAMNEGMFGLGTDDDLLKEKLKGKSKEEIAKLKAEYAEAAKKYGSVDNADLIADVEGETSGRAGHELHQSLKGNPTTLEEMRQRAAEDYAFERTESSWVGEVGMAALMGPFAYPAAKAMGVQPTDIANGLTDMWSGTGQRLDKTHAEVEAKYLALKSDPRFAGYDQTKPGSPERAAMDKAMMAELQGNVDWQEGDLKGFEEAKDATADVASTAVAITVGAVVTIASGGTAAPAVVALISGLAGVGTKMMIRGGSMSNEEIVQEVAAVIAETAAAGIVKIEKIDKFVEGIGKLAGGNNKLVAKIVQEALEEAIESGSEEFINAVMDPELYKGDLADWSKGVALRTGKAIGTGAVTASISTTAGDLMPDGKTWKGRAAKGAASQMVGAAVSSGMDPGTYEGSVEDKWTRFARSQGEAGLRGARDTLGSAENKADRNTDAHAAATDAHVDAKADTHVDAKADTHAGASTDASTASADASTDASTANADASVDAKVDVNAQAQVAPSADTQIAPAQAQADADAKSKADADAVAKADAAAKAEIEAKKQQKSTDEDAAWAQFEAEKAKVAAAEAAQKKADEAKAWDEKRAKEAAEKQTQVDQAWDGKAKAADATTDGAQAAVAVDTKATTGFTTESTTPKLDVPKTDRLSPQDRAVVDKHRTDLAALSQQSMSDPMAAAAAAEARLAALGIQVIRSKEVALTGTKSTERKAAELRANDPTLTEDAARKLAASTGSKGMYGYDPKSNSVIIPGSFTIHDRAPDLSNPIELELARVHARAVIEELTHATNYNIHKGEFVALNDDVAAFTKYVTSTEGREWMAAKGLSIDTRNGVEEMMPHEVDIMRLHQDNAEYSASEVERYELRKAFAAWSAEHATEASTTTDPNAPTAKPAATAEAKTPKAPLQGDTSFKADTNQDGVQDAARVGVKGTEIPSEIPRMPGLDPEQAAAEAKFAQAYENDPKALAAAYLEMVAKGQTDPEAKNFATDDAKLLSPDYNKELGDNATDADKQQALAARGMMNIAVHQTANAVAKLAFTMRLDQIANDPSAAKTILVTAGGVGAGKSYSIDNNPEASALKAKSSAVWDSAGEQNSTELPWVIAEAKKRGLEVAVVYVHRKPEQSWENMKFGVIPRAAKSGRMVDSRLHADSYAEGARNFDAVQAGVGNDPNVKFVVIDSTGDKPVLIDRLPPSALELDAELVHKRNVEFLDSQKANLPEHVVKGGNEIGQKIWGGADVAGADASTVADAKDAADTTKPAAEQTQAAEKTAKTATEGKPEVTAEAKVDDKTDDKTDGKTETPDGTLGPAAGSQYIESSVEDLMGHSGGIGLDDVLAVALKRANSANQPVKFKFNGETVVVAPGSNVRQIYLNVVFGGQIATWNPKVQTAAHPTLDRMQILPGTATPLNVFVQQLAQYNLSATSRGSREAEGLGTVTDGMLELSAEALKSGVPTWRELHTLKLLAAEAAAPGTQKLDGKAVADVPGTWLAPEVPLRTRSSDAPVRESMSFRSVAVELDTLQTAVAEAVAAPAASRAALNFELAGLTQTTTAKLTQQRMTLDGAMVAVQSGRLTVEGGRAIIDLEGRSVEIPVRAGADSVEVMARLKEMHATTTRLEAEVVELRNAVKQLVRRNDDLTAAQVVELAKRSQQVANGEEVAARAAAPAKTETAGDTKKQAIIPSSSDWEMDVAEDKIPESKRQAALAKYGDLVKRLEADFMVPMPRGQASVEMMAAITLITGKECGLFRTETGERVLTLGDQTSVPGPKNFSKLIAHTHPGGNLIFSPADIHVLQNTDQKSSVLISPAGRAIRQSTEVNQHQTQASTEHIELQSRMQWNDDPEQRVMSGSEVAQEAMRLRGAPDVPLAELALAPRLFESVGSNKGMGVAVAPRHIDTAADLDAIRKGQASQGADLPGGGRTFEVNGRVYGEQYGRVFPVSGKGIIALDATAAHYYRIYRDYFDTAPDYVAKQLKGKEQSPAAVAARDAFNAERGIESGSKADTDTEAATGVLGRMKTAFGRLFGKSAGSDFNAHESTEHESTEQKQAPEVTEQVTSAETATNTAPTSNGKVDSAKLDSSKVSAISQGTTPSEKASAQQLGQSVEAMKTKFEGDLGRFDTTLVPGPANRPVIDQSPSDALIGLPIKTISPTLSGEDAAKQMAEQGIPRWGALTEKERAHETAFANQLEADLPGAVDQFFAMSKSPDGVYIFEVDGAKKLYAQYGKGKGPANDAELDVRATANHAMHPASVTITRIAMLRALDQLKSLPAGDPRKALFVTNGGCAAGKGSLTEIVREQNGGKLNFGAVWDAAGEGDAQENAWLLAAAQARGIKVSFGFVENDPMFTYNAVLNRAKGSGRIVDPLTFARSYVRGQENMRAFLQSEAYQKALAAGEVDAIGVYTGKFDVALDKYPDKRMLGDNGKIGADDIAPAPEEGAVTGKAIEIFEKWLKDEAAAGRKIDHWLEGGAVNALKFDPNTSAKTSTPTGPETGDQKSTADTADTKDTKAQPQEQKEPATAAVEKAVEAKKGSDQESKGLESPAEHGKESGPVEHGKAGTHELTESKKIQRPTKQDRKGVPEHIPVDAAEVRAFIEAKYPIVAKYKAHLTSKLDANAEFQPLLDELRALKPGELAADEARADRIMQDWGAASKKIAASEAAKGNTRKTEEGPELRDLYNSFEKTDMPVFIKELHEVHNLPPDIVATMAHMMREEVKIYIRDLMSDTNSKEVLYLRDRGLYGYRRGPAFDEYFQELVKTTGSEKAAYTLLIKKATQSNRKVNKMATGNETGLKDPPTADPPATDVKDPPVTKPGDPPTQ